MSLGLLTLWGIDEKGKKSIIFSKDVEMEKKYVLIDGKKIEKFDFFFVNIGKENTNDLTDLMI